MSYEALARKYRPRAFLDVVGQPHVVRALSNALDSGRIHHAFLFTGTRGVGKTTIARILAKALNCDEKGTSADPCGHCSACTSIDEGRYFDLIEVDAASRTKVDDTRELLDNVQYAPTHGRFKVYLIDEVHMLTGHSFNALLKTLEEPPAHVKFLLATTDPQKLPVTVLSRCLQFNLRALDDGQILDRLEKIAAAEDVSAERDALGLIARAGDGSMRDALSLLDQAIAYGDGAVTEASVRDMLGLIEDRVIEEVLGALGDGDANTLVGAVNAMAERSYDYVAATDDLLLALNEIAVHQQAPSTLAKSGRNVERLAALAAALAPEDVQLYYQIGLIAKRDISLAPNPRSGFEMMLLRMLAFKPATPDSESIETRNSVVSNEFGAAPTQALARDHATVPRSTAEEESAAINHARATTPAAPISAPLKVDSPQTLLAPEIWRRVVEGSALRGLSRELAMNMCPSGFDGGTLIASIDSASRHLMSESRQRSVEKIVGDAVGASVKLELSVTDDVADTPASAKLLEQRDRARDAEVTIATDPAVRALSERFDATIVPDSVVPAKDD